MALAPLAYTLYTRVMRHNPANAAWPDRDRFVLSCGPRLDAALLDPLPVRLRPRARGPRELPPARLAVRRPPRVRRTRRASRRRPGRSARASRRASAWRSPSACSPRASTATGHEIVDHHTFTIASDGDMEEGIAVRGRLARRPPRPRPPDRLLRRQPHLDRGRHRSWRSARTSARATRPTAGTSSTSARTSRVDRLEAGRARRRWRSRTARR